MSTRLCSFSTFCTVFIIHVFLDSVWHLHFSGFQIHTCGRRTVLPPDMSLALKETDFRCATCASMPAHYKVCWCNSCKSWRFRVCLCSEVWMRVCLGPSGPVHLRSSGRMSLWFYYWISQRLLVELLQSLLLQEGHQWIPHVHHIQHLLQDLLLVSLQLRTLLRVCTQTKQQ